MACDPNVFAEVPIFSLLDADERAILADHVDLRRFVARQRIYKAGDPGGRAYIVLNGVVEVSMVDEEQRRLRFADHELDTLERIARIEGQEYASRGVHGE